MCIIHLSARVASLVSFFKGSGLENLRLANAASISCQVRYISVTVYTFLDQVRVKCKDGSKTLGGHTFMFLVHHSRLST
jgi:hypothetical protein